MDLIVVLNRCHRFPKFVYGKNSFLGDKIHVDVRAIQWVVAYGLAHRTLGQVHAIGIDEIAVWTGHKYLTVVYQIDEGCRRLLWVGRDRTKATLETFFTMFGETRAKALKFVC